MPLTIAPLYVALATIILLILTVRVIRLRRRLAIGLGTGGDAELESAIRGHGNFTEYAPIGLIVLASAELSGAAGAWVHAIGILLIGGLAAPDASPVTMLLIAAPMYVLYELGIWVIVLLEKSWKREGARLP